MAETVKVVYLSTKSATRIVIRNGAGKKLCDIDVSGVSITVTVPPDSDIQVDPPQAVAQANPEESES